MTIPKILISNPAPRNEQRYFRGKPLSVWMGKAKVEDIQGWVDNPRLDLHLKRFREAHANRDPEQDEILAIMSADKGFELSKLVTDIRENGVRTPIILSNSGVLLDGNRRFFAIKKLISETNASDPMLADYKYVPVIVLSETCTDADEKLVLWHENFYPDLKHQWPDFVLASFVSSRLEDGEDEKTVATTFGWTKAKVRETKKIMELIKDFLEFATSEPTGESDGLGLSENEAEGIASTSYQFFNEAQKSFYDKLFADYDFKIQFFNWIYEGKFASFPQVRVAYQAWDNDNLRKILKSDDPEAAARVLAEVQYRKVVKQDNENASQKISDFEKFLNDLKAVQLSSLTDEDIVRLESILKKVKQMSEAGRKAK